MDYGKLIYESGYKKIYRNGKITYKVFAPSVSKARVLNEALNQARAEETDIDVPRLLDVTSKNGEGWVISYEFIEGLSLGQLIEKHPEKEDMYIDYFVKLHLKTINDNSYLFNRLREKMSRKISETSLSPQVKGKLMNRLSTLPIQAKICHGDFIPDNVIITKDKIPYIIDWSHTSQGCGAADVATTYLSLVRKYGEKFAEKYIEKIELKSSYTKKQIFKWIPLVSACKINSTKGEEKAFYIARANLIEFEEE